MDSRISEEGGRWVVDGTTFDSRQAAELYAQSRAPGAGAVAGPGVWASLPWYGKAVAIVGALYVAGALVSLLAPSPQPGRAEAGAQPVGPAPSLMSKAEGFATLINLNGQLCASVTAIERLHGDVFSVSCVRYRDGTGSATYEVDLATGRAK